MKSFLQLIVPFVLIVVQGSRSSLVNDVTGALPKVQIGTGFYYFENNIMANWYQAYEFCRTHDMYLLSVETEEEDNLLIEYLENQGFYAPYWMSLTDLAVYNTYIWGSTGKRATYTNWQATNPDHNNDTLGIEHCVEYRGNSTEIWGWNDRPALSERNFICEEICETCLVDINNTETTAIENQSTPRDGLTVNLNGTNYYFESNLRANWYEAHEFCRAHGMHLLTLETRYEELLVINELMKQVPGLANHWLGATDLSVEDVWMWSGTGQRMVYANWASGEPSHTNTANKTENAVYLGLDAEGEYHWFDGHEFDLRYLICEEICMALPSCLSPA